VNDATGALHGVVATTDCDVTLASNAFARATVHPSGGTLGAQVANPFPFKTSSASASHGDSWTCSPLAGDSCVMPPGGMPVAVALKLEGTVSSPNTTFIVNATYAMSSGQFFLIEIGNEDGLGGFAQLRSPGGGAIDFPVSITVDAANAVHFLVDVKTTTHWVCPAGCEDSIDPQFAFQTDSQDIDMQVTGDATSPVLDAIHTFGVSVTPLDPSIVLTSADGRIGRASGMNQPTPIQPPINADGSSTFNVGRTVPVRIAVYGPSGKPVDGLAPKISLAMIAPTSGDVNEVLFPGNADVGNTMRGLGSGAYMFNLSTKLSQFNAGQDLVPGRYRLTITDPSFTAPVVVEFGLR
jgi:hypothetical protein